MNKRTLVNGTALAFFVSALSLTACGGSDAPAGEAASVETGEAQGAVTINQIGDLVVENCRATAMFEIKADEDISSVAIDAGEWDTDALDLELIEVDEEGRQKVIATETVSMSRSHLLANEASRSEDIDSHHSEMVDRTVTEDFEASSEDFVAASNSSESSVFSSDSNESDVTASSRDLAIDISRKDVDADARVRESVSQSALEVEIDRDFRSMRATGFDFGHGHHHDHDDLEVEESLEESKSVDKAELDSDVKASESTSASSDSLDKALVESDESVHMSDASESALVKSDRDESELLATSSEERHAKISESSSISVDDSVSKDLDESSSALEEETLDQSAESKAIAEDSQRFRSFEKLESRASRKLLLRVSFDGSVSATELQVAARTRNFFGEDNFDAGFDACDTVGGL